ncbi:uncharacterized protein LOC143599903 [Bidens hawaiensis]|uniref:uncharacterized protein LOC143599903 n=1 Tax=Bidens hawaiensis TaxID=980011 RepID=UPI00404B3BB8
MQVAHLSTAKEIWDTLKTRFVGVDKVRETLIEFLQHEFDVLKMKKTNTIDDFSTNITQIASKASNLGEPYEEKTLMRRLLESIPRKRYIAIVATIDQFADIKSKSMTFHEVVGRLKAFEERYGDEDKSVSGKQEQLLYRYKEWKAKSNQERRHRKDKIGTKSSQKNKGKSKVVDRENKEPRVKKDQSKIKCYCCDELGYFATSCLNREKRSK